VVGKLVNELLLLLEYKWDGEDKSLWEQTLCHHEKNINKLVCKSYMNSTTDEKINLIAKVFAKK
jgi:hypothetical protein